MIRPRNRAVRIAGTLFIAALMPLLVHISLLVAFSAQTNRSKFETSAFEQARHVITSVDAVLERTRGAAAALATTKSIDQRDWPAAYTRAKELMEQNPDWDAVILWDRDHDQEIFDTGHPFGPRKKARDLGLEGHAPSKPNDLVLSNLQLTGERCPCVYAHAATRRGNSLILTVRLHVSSFQRVLARESSGLISASLFDRRGVTIGRIPWRPLAVDAAKMRTASPASVTDAVSGSYRGAEFEAKDKFIVYWKSQWTGWSAHLAFPPEAVDEPRWRQTGASLIAGLGSLAIAITVALLTFRIFRAQEAEGKRHLEAAAADAEEQRSLARDLHDGTLQFLAGAQFRIEDIKRALRQGAVDLSVTELDGLQFEFRREQRQLRRFIESLGPDLRHDPPASILEIRSELSRRWGVEIIISPFYADDLIPEHLNRDITYILSEAVSNAVRHGAANRIAVSLSREEGILAMKISDNGFSGAAVAGNEERMTSASILARVLRHGGDLHIDHDDGGLSLNIKFPRA